MRLEPINIQQIGDELAVAWSDGAESFLELEMLRRACPCAACGGEPDVLGRIARPHVSYNDKSFKLVGFDLVGVQPFRFTVCGREASALRGLRFGGCDLGG